MNSDPFPQETGLTLDETSHRYFINGTPVRWSVTGIIKEMGLIDHQWATEDDMKFGSDVHLTTQLYDEGRLDEKTLDPRLAGYLEGWIKFRRETGFIPHKIERRIYCSTMKFAGTLDRFGKTDDNALPWLVEIKTYPVPDWCALQTAAYKFTIGIPCRRFGVELKSSGTYKMREFSNPLDVNDFSCLIAALETKRRYGGIKNDTNQ
jgi:hypothetical protein